MVRQGLFGEAWGQTQKGRQGIRGQYTGTYAPTAPQAFANVTLPAVGFIAARELTKACGAKPELKSGINVMSDQVLD